MPDLPSLQHQARQNWAAIQNPAHPVIYLGAASCGRAAGVTETRAAVEEFLAEHHLEASIVEVGCIGLCYLEPLMDVQLPGVPRVCYAKVTPRLAKEILTSTLLTGAQLCKYAIGYLGETTASAPAGLAPLFEHPMLKLQKRIVLRNCGTIDPTCLDHYLARDGYVGLLQALQQTPAEVIETVRRSGLRGRGGAGFPTYKKWEICRASPGETKHLICNADEGDPGAFMNRALIESDPHAVLEGMTIAAYAIGASHGVIYIRAEYPLAIQRLKTALEQMRAAGLTGKNILGSDFSFEIKIKEGAGAFVCGEETALIASVEGQRGMPRSRPPFPAVAGLHGQPTVINNAETMGTLPNILRNGADWYHQSGTPTSPGTKTFSLAGKIQRSGLIEVPLGTSLRQIIFDIGGGTRKAFKAVQTGGPSGGCLSEQYLDTPVDYEALRAAGSIMGSGGLVVMDEDTCVVDVARYFLQFAQRESCGKCVPCRVGVSHLVQRLEQICSSASESVDLDELLRLAGTIQKSSLCGLGQSAPNPILTTLRNFRPEYEAHIHQHYCPAAVCKGLYQLTILAERCTGCGLCRKSCPVNAIQGERGKPHVLDAAVCIQCRACVLACRFDAITGIIPTPVPLSTEVQA